jgi:hypothetical protein
LSCLLPRWIEAGGSPNGLFAAPALSDPRDLLRHPATGFAVPGKTKAGFGMPLANVHG